MDTYHPQLGPYDVAIGTAPAPARVVEPWALVYRESVVLVERGPLPSLEAGPPGRGADWPALEDHRPQLRVPHAVNSTGPPVAAALEAALSGDGALQPVSLPWRSELSASLAGGGTLLAAVSAVPTLAVEASGGGE